MAQELIYRIREAERRGDELEKQAAADAQTRVREAEAQAAELVRRAAAEAEKAGREKLVQAVQEGEAVKETARRKAEEQASRLRSRAEEGMTDAVEQAARLLLS